jgi:hypothetical protein
VTAGVNWLDAPPTIAEVPNNLGIVLTALAGIKAAVAAAVGKIFG